MKKFNVLLKMVVAAFAFAMALSPLCFQVQVFASQSYDTYLGQFSTVAVYSNGYAGYNSRTNNYVNGTYTGIKWQCVEYVRRYYLTVFNLDLASLHTGNADIWWNNASTMRLDRYSNGGITPPAVGDILTSNASPDGHISIIRYISNGRVYTAQQNFSNDYSDVSKPLTLTVSGGTYTISGQSGIQGWLRKSGQPAQASATWHPDGSLLLDTNGAVWLIENKKKRLIPDQWTFVSNSFVWSRIVKVSAQELSCFEDSGNLNPGTQRRLLRAPNGAVYLVTDSGYRRAFTSADVFDGLGYVWDEVVNVSDATIGQYPPDPVAPILDSPFADGTLIKGSSSTIYVISNGRKWGIASSTAFDKLGYKYSDVIQVSDSLLGSIDNIADQNNTPLEPIDDTTVDICYTSAMGGGDPDPAFTISASVNPNTASVNQTVSINATVTSTGGAVNDAIVDLEVYTSANQKVAQRVFEHQYFSPNQSLTYTLSFTPSSADAYRVKIGVFNNNWTVNYHWNDNAAALTVGGSSPPPSSYTMDVWWPVEGSQLSQVTPFKALVNGLSLNQYSMTWSVEGGQENPMYDSYVDWPHKETQVDVSGWSWRGSGPYTIIFRARDTNSTTLAQRSVNVYVAH